MRGELRIRERGGEDRPPYVFLAKMANDHERLEYLLERTEAGTVAVEVMGRRWESPVRWEDCSYACVIVGGKLTTMIVAGVNERVPGLGGFFHEWAVLSMKPDERDARHALVLEEYTDPPTELMRYNLPWDAVERVHLVLVRD